MGTVSICEPKIEQKNSQNAKESIKYIIKRQKPINKIISLKKENNIQFNNDNKIKFNNYSPKVKDILKSKIFEPSQSLTKNSSNKCKTNSYNSYTLTTTNNNSKNIMTNNKIITNDNNTKKTITEEETINNPDSIDYSNNTKLNNSKCNKLKLNDSIKITKEKKKRMKKTKMFNIINKENEDIFTKSRNYKGHYKDQKNKIKNFSLFSPEINSLHNSIKPIIPNKNIIYFSNFSSKRTLKKSNNNSQNKISKKSFHSQVKSGLTYTQNSLHKKTSSDIKCENNLMNKRNKKMRISLDDKFMNKNNKNKKYKRYFISEFNSFYSVRKCESYKNENNIIKKLRITKMNQENEIKLLKMKVNSLCNMIEDHKYIKENELKKKDKLILDLQKEKIKNEKEIKKLKTQLKKERKSQKNKNNINNKYEIKKLNIRNNKNNRSFKRNGNIAHLNTEYTSNKIKEKNKDAFNNIIYHKKSKIISDNMKQKIFKKNSPINLRKNIGSYIRRSLGQSEYEKDIIKYKDTYFIKGYNSEIKNENQFLTGLNQNKSYFDKEIGNVNVNNLMDNKIVNNIVYIPKRSKLSQKCVLFWNNKKRQLGKSKSTTNKYDMVLKFNELNKEKNDQIKNSNKNNIILEENYGKVIKRNETNLNNNTESISLNGTNKFKDSINKNEEITMNLDFSPIIEDNSNNKILANDDTSIYDLFLLNNNININANYHSENNSPKNKNKLNISQKSKNKTPSPIANRAKKLSDQNLILKNIIRKVNYYINNEDKLKLSFIFGKDKIDFICKKNILFFNAINYLFIKIKENDFLNQKFGHMLEYSKKLYFISNDIILDKNKTLEENNLNNHAKIFVIFDE